MEYCDFHLVWPPFSHHLFINFSCFFRNPSRIDFLPILFRFLPEKCDFGALLGPSGVPKSTLGATFSANKPPKAEWRFCRGASRSDLFRFLLIFIDFSGFSSIFSEFSQIFSIFIDFSTIFTDFPQIFHRIWKDFRWILAYCWDRFCRSFRSRFGAHTPTNPQT